MKVASFITLVALISIAVGDVDFGSKRCFLKPDPGPCRGSFKKWFFNPKTKQCESFIYGGCKGQVPFDTEEQCERSCEVKDPCKLLPDPGPCKAYIPSWFFNQKTRKCERFIWGGCDGVRPFVTLEACEKKCEKNRCDLTPKDVLPKPGTITCQAFWVSWYFNKFTGSCESFSYSACSNLGPFTSQEECEKEKCICKLRPADTKTGPVTCQAFWTTWFYNEDSGKCDKFSYSGCSPIGFTSEKKCLTTCP